MNKAEFRSLCLKKARGLMSHQRYNIDKRISRLLEQHIRASNAKSVMLYVPLELEVDVMLLIGILRRRGVDVLVPFMDGESFRLVKYRLPLIKKRYGVKEPKYSKQYKIKTIDIAVVPIVGTDASFRRIGFGKGMYDRFFSKNRKRIKQIVFIQRKICYSQEILTNHYDIKADLIIT